MAVATYLSAVAEEADARGYRFDGTRLNADPDAMLRMAVTRGQLELELEHLRAKVLARAPKLLGRLGSADPHPVFHVVPGPPESWERHRS